MAAYLGRHEEPIKIVPIPSQFSPLALRGHILMGVERLSKYGLPLVFTPGPKEGTLYRVWATHQKVSCQKWKLEGGAYLMGCHSCLCVWFSILGKVIPLLNLRAKWRLGPRQNFSSLMYLCTSPICAHSECWVCPWSYKKVTIDTTVRLHPKQWRGGKEILAGGRVLFEESF